MTIAVTISLASAGLALLLGWLAVSGTWALRRRARINKRLSPVADLLTAEKSDTTRVPVPLMRNRSTNRESALVAWLDARYPLAGGVRAALVASVAAIVIGAVSVLAFSFFGVPSTLALAAAVLLGAGIGRSVAALLEHARREEFSSRFLVVLEDFNRMVRYGITSNQALDSVAVIAQEPVRRSLRNIKLETEFGVPLGTAMDREARRVRVSELSMLAAVVSTQSATGGNLSESVTNLSAMLRDRLDNRSKLKASTAESRITMIILTGVPFAGVGLQAALQPDLVDVMVNEARHLLGIGVALIFAGLAISWKMIRSAQR